MHNLVLPDTFVNGTSATTGGTWKAARGGGWYRIDFVAIPARWLSTVCAAAPAYSWDTHSASIDHVPVLLSLRRCPVQGPRLATWRTKPIPRTAGEDKKGVDLFNTILAAADVPPWTMPADKHHEQISKLVAFAAKEAFESPAARPFKTFISEASWSMVRRKHWIRTMLNNIRRSRGECQQQLA